MQPFAEYLVSHHPRDPDFDRRVRDSYARQAFMASIGATLESVAPGEVVIALPWRGDLTQQHGFVHAGAITAIADSACGYAALSLMSAGAGVLSVEFKINLLSPATGHRFRATGRVARAGRTLTICAAEVHAERENGTQLIALMQATMMSLPQTEGVAD